MFTLRHRRFRSKRLVSILLILSILCVIFYYTHIELRMEDERLVGQDHVSSSKLLNSDLDKLHENENSMANDQYRKATLISPFSLAMDDVKAQLKKQSKQFWFFRKTKINENAILNKWSKMPKAQQCRSMIKAFYTIPDWTHRDILKSYENDSVGSLVFSLMVERMRIYDYCFLHGSEDSEQIFNDDFFKQKSINSTNFNERMFPFINYSADKMLWPSIYNLTSDTDSGKYSIMSKPSLENESVESFNANFWQNWIKFSNGKGIVVTLPADDASLFYRQLKVFKTLGNELPIQVVTTGSEVSEEFMTKLSAYSKKAGQQIYLVDTSPILDKSFTEKHITFFMNKWIADMLNTFEEFMFIDTDAVPYIPPVDFFSNAAYTKSGILMFRDRSLIDENTFQRCVDLLHHAEPTKEELNLISSKLSFDSVWYKNHVNAKENGDKGDFEFIEAQVYENFFHKLHLHHVDSGLVVVNKKKKMNGLLLSFFFNLDSRLYSCVYGDKEILWLGELFAGEDYSINPLEGSIVGPLNREKQEGNKMVYSVCATQIAHTDENDKLLWTNGGLKTCKFTNSASGDYDSDEQYFKSRYENVDRLQQLYDSPLAINGVIIPDPTSNPWMQIKECSKYMYCAIANKFVGDESAGKGHVIEFDDESIALYRKISEIWNKNN